MPAVTSPKNLTIGFLIIAALGLGVLAWSQYQELIGLRAAGLKGDERADLQKRLWAAEKRARDLESQLAALKGASPADALAALAGGESESSRGGNRGNRGNQPGGAALRALLEKPEIQHLLSLQQKAGLDLRYAALFKKLNLTSEQVDKVKDLMVDRQTSRQDIMAAARDQGIDPRSDPAGYRKLMTDAQAESDNALKAALGDAGYAQLQQYDQTMPQRGVVNQLQQSLSFTGSPLTDAQADQLVQILATNNATANANSDGGPGGFRGGGGFGGGGFPGGGGGAALIGAFAGFGGGNNAPVTTEALTQAQGILSAPQLAALQQVQQTQQAQQEVQQMIRQTMGNNNAGGARAQRRGPASNAK